ncbi:hypothetical protein MFLO_01035 [Listeria floridensis FSL S10-1187]|uniref:Uncharacterized protein n=1 Tax=Listeria floridensis FSL S10-1187 TaxID=1265817 RepID=A0ABN0RIH3_9LIST|nr:hypothetical protein [Listeria floridensis]EUJ33775.1 hypothetical protein MFLO_01035 [Listeria floridensis FSL S10-1187]
MDVVHEKQAQHLRGLNMQQQQAERDLQTFQKKREAFEWLELDYQSLISQQTELKEMLQHGWQGDTAQGLHQYIEEKQEVEQRMWKRELDTQKEEGQEDIRQLKQRLLEIDQQQAKIRKELTL